MKATTIGIDLAKLHIPADHEHHFRTNVNAHSGSI